MTGLVDGSPRDPHQGTEVDGSDGLHRLERQFAQIQRLAQFGSWEWDVVTGVLTCSDELYRIAGMVPGEVQPTYETVLGRIHPDDRDVVDQDVRRAIADRVSFAVDHRLVRPDGEIRWLHCRGDVVLDGDGETQRVYGVAIDITERKRADQFLQDFIGNAAHALGTPSAVVIQAAHVLANSDLAEADYEAALGALVRQAKRLRDLSTNLFDLVALDKGAPSVMFGLSMLLVPVSLVDAVHKAAVASLPEGSDKLTIDIADDITVLAESIELERVFVNLFTNANISVTARRLGDEVVVDVRDDGPGIPDDQLRDLFVPFAKHRTGQGSGLGLAVVHRLMIAFGGAVSYHRAEPRGSVFTVRFSVD
jgi:PAS domain S-box-containing protein